MRKPLLTIIACLLAALVTAQEPGKTPALPYDGLSVIEDPSSLAASFRRHTSVTQGAPARFRMSAFVRMFDSLGGVVRDLELSDDDFDTLSAFAMRERRESHQASMHVRREACNLHVIGRPATSIDVVAMSTALYEGRKRNNMAVEQRFITLLEQLSPDGRAQVTNQLTLWDASIYQEHYFPAIVAEHPDHYAGHFQNLCSQPIDPVPPAPTFVSGIMRDNQE